VRGIGTGGVDIRESEEGDGGGVQSAEEGKDFWMCLISTTMVAGIGDGLNCSWS